MDLSHLPVPTIWAGIALVFGSVTTFAVMYRINSKFGPLQSQALNSLVEVQKAQITATTETLKMQKDHYELEMGELKGEREDYKAKLHEEKNLHQAALLLVAELQARPDVDRVYKEQQTFFTQMASTMKSIQTSIAEHDKGLEQRTAKIVEPVQQMCSEVVKALNGHTLVKVKENT